MNILSAENISKSYVEKKLLDNISLGINEGDKIGVIGINGTGKSTFLKVIAGVEEADEGKIIKGSSMTINYLPQNPKFCHDASVLDQVFSGESKVLRLIREYEKAVNDKDTPSEKIVELSLKMDALGAWNIESEAKTVLTKLGISNFNEKIGTLSGGQKKRVALASALINPCDLLILDEPTNHLDNDTIDWLEEYLNKRKGALLMVTHDRYFLDRVANKIIELHRGHLYTYEGNYSVFLEKKIERESISLANEKKRQSLIRKELSWIKRGAKARTTKQKARIERFEKLTSEEPEVLDEKLKISSSVSRLGKKVIELKDIDKSYGDKKLIDNFSYTVLRDDRIGIIGPNGIGKSTLINILSGNLKPDRGTVDIGETVKIGLYAQEPIDMDDNLRVIEYIKESAEFFKTADGSKISASQMLERFLFPPELQWTYIGKLSGGEKRRLYLLKVLAGAPNVLILDEPTNDLDIETLMVLEEYIDDFKGPVIAISHDRYFLDRIAEKIFAFEGNGKIREYTGNYSYFKDVKSSCEDDKSKVEKTPKVTQKISGERKKENQLKFSYKEQKEYEEIDDIIAELEGKIKQLDEDINNAVSDYNLLQQLLEEKEEIQRQLDEKMDRWVYLNELADKIAKSKNKM